MLNGLIALRTPREMQGAAFGASQTAHAIGVGFGPLIGGAASVAFGLKSVFLIDVGVFALILVMAVVLMGRGVPEPSRAAA